MTIIEIISATLLVLGGIFFLAGTIGILRFHNVHSRLHALSKADNLGLGFICSGLILTSESVSTGAKILIIWLLALLASAVTCFVIANWEAAHGRSNRDL